MRNLSLLLSMTLLLTLAGCGQGDRVGAQKAEEKDSAKKGDGDDGEKAAEAPAIPKIKFTRAFSNLTFARPVLLTHAGDETDRVFVVEQAGKIKVFKNDDKVESARVFLDISEKVYEGHNEEGLLALAFHPKFKKNREFFVYYSHKISGDGRSAKREGIISRFKVSRKDKNLAEAESEEIILKVPQPWGNHNGCMLMFGTDGFLYASLGDGGAGGDPINSGQDRSTLLGNILRIDIDKKDKGKEYAVPKDNPFVKEKGVCPEIWAYGLRNVWRMSFDRETGDLYAGDVGQNAWEEIDIITKGGNYGWNWREGKHDYKRSQKDGEKPKDMIEPIAEYPQERGGSVTGGYVYRGKKHKALTGWYFYSDYAFRKTWALKYVKGKVLANGVVDEKIPAISSWGEDEAGELYVCSFKSGGRDGRRALFNQSVIYRLEPAE